MSKSLKKFITIQCAWLEDPSCCRLCTFVARHAAPSVDSVPCGQSYISLPHCCICMLHSAAPAPLLRLHVGASITCTTLPEVGWHPPCRHLSKHSAAARRQEARWRPRKKREG